MSFTLHIDAQVGIEELAKALRSTHGLGLEPVEIRKSLKGAWIDLANKDAHLRLFKNLDYEPRLVDDEDGWLYYRYILEATRASRDASDEIMKNLANALLTQVRDLGGTVEILSDWDDEDVDL